MLNTELILSTVMAFFLAYIAYQQLETNRKKLKLDLYNKRFEVYSVTLEFFHELTGQGASKDLLRKFIEKKEAAQFIFSEDPSIYSLLNEMHKESFKITTFKEDRNNQEDSPSLTTSSARDAQDAAEWFCSAVTNLSKKMEAFLKF